MEDTSTEYVTIEMLRTWKMDQLIDLLLTRGLKRRGKKDVLVKMVCTESCYLEMILPESDLDDTLCVTHKGSKSAVEKYLCTLSSSSS